MAAYVADTHALYWYLKDPDQLGPGADAVFRLAEVDEVVIFVPAIVVAEIFYLTKKRGAALPPARLIDSLDNGAGFEFSDLGREQLERLSEIGIDEMHDRLIAAEALAKGATVITKDELLRQSADVTTVW